MSKLRRIELESLIGEEVPDVESLVLMLELTMEDILERFPDRVLEHKGKFGIPEATDGILDDEDEIDEFLEDEDYFDDLEETKE
jgi:hypothetical protein